MGDVLEFRTDSIEPENRLEVWGERVWSKLGGLETRTPGRELFEASLVAAQLGLAQVCRITVGPHRIDRTQRLIRQCDPELVKIVYQVRGQVCLEQLDQRLVMSPGDWCIYEGSKPYGLFNLQPAEQIALVLPRQALTGKAFDLSACLAKPFLAASGVAMILRQCLISTLKETDAMGGQARADLGETLIELARMALQEKLGRSHATGKEQMRERVKAFIRKNISDTQLSVESISSHFNCTTRYLHKIFDGEETTLSRFIWNTRLERCSRELGSLAEADRSITEIAFQWGFSNSAHFSRAFRERFGASPRTYRALQMGRLAS